MKISLHLLTKVLCSFCLGIISFALFLPVSAWPGQTNSQQVVFFIASFHHSWQIFQVDPNGTNLKQTITTAHDVLKLSLTADGQKLLYLTGDKKSFLLDLDTKERIEFETELKGTVDAVLSKDNSTLLFSLSTGGSNDANHIWLADITTNDITQLTHMEGMQYSPIWSHDDKSIFFLSGGGGQNEDIWRLDVASGSLNQLTAGQLYNFELSCSLDNEIAFSSNRNGDYEIWAMDPFGGNVRQLTHSPGMDSHPSWSPDGEHIVFVSTRSGQPALYIMDREGKTTRRLSPEGLICRNSVWGR